MGDLRKWVFIKRAAEMLSVSKSHLHDLDRAGHLGDLPRDIKKRRMFDLSLIDEWNRHGIPGSTIHLAGPTIVTAGDSPVPREAQTPAATPAPVPAPTVIPDREYQSSSNIVQRAKDEIEVRRLDIEKLKLDRQMEALESVGDGGGDGNNPQGGLVVELIRQQGEILRQLIASKPSVPDNGINTALDYIKIGKEVAGHPEGKLFERFADILMDKFMQAGGLGDEKETSLLDRLAPIFAPVLEKLISSAGQAPASLPPRGRAPELPVDDDAENSATMLEAPDTMNIIAQVFEISLNAYRQGVSVDQAMTMITAIFGNQFPVGVVRVVNSSFGTIKLIAKTFHPDTAAAMKDADGAKWFEDLIVAIQHMIAAQEHNDDVDGELSPAVPLPAPNNP